MMRARAAVTIALLAAFAAACASDRDECAEVAANLKKCGIAVSSDLVCADRTATDAIASRLDAQGCEGIAADATGTVDKRVCDLGGFSCPPPPTPDPSGATPKYPLVFVSGIDGTPTFDWNTHITATLRSNGIDTQHVQVSPWASTAQRAADLWSAIEALVANGTKKVNLVCYAVGGIDCRFLASPNGLFADDKTTFARVKNAIASVTTIATPHRGTHVADAALAALQSGAATDILTSLVGASPIPPSDGALAQTLEALTTTAMADFDDRVPDADGIYYQSWAGVSHVLGKSSETADRQANDACGTFYRHDGTNDTMNDLLWVTAPFAGVPSDGMIPVESAKHGDFRGCIPADHYDVIGQIGHVTRDVSTGFDDVRFYELVAGNLADKGL